MMRSVRVLLETCSLAVAASVLCLGLASAANAQSADEHTQRATHPKTAATSAADKQREQIQQLVIEVEAAEQRVRDSERELDQLKAKLGELQAALAAPDPASSSSAASTLNPAAKSADAATQEQASSDTTDQLQMQASQIATLDQSKVETSTKYPFKMTGEVLLTAGVNTAAADSPIVPTASFSGPGTTALSVRQTVLGFNASGPRLAGATSSADLRVDFFGTSATASYPSAGGLLRLRTAHAALDWPHATVFFSLDRPLLSPDTPASLVQVAEPALAWSGNLWNWSPQLGVSTHFGSKQQILVEGAWISPPDAPYPGAITATSTTESPTLAERSRAPGGEARIAVSTGDSARAPRLGVGGYVSPHSLSTNASFRAWAGTMDLRLPITQRAEFVASAYFGQALGGLGAGGYKDYVYREIADRYQIRTPDDVGGWTQLAVHLRHTLDWNSAFGMDNIYARQVRFLYVRSNDYGSVARNRTLSSNLIWSPRDALLFSFEFRHLSTFPISGGVWNTDVFAGAAGYRF